MKTARRESRAAGVRQIIAFNWPKLVTAGGVVTAAVIVATVAHGLARVAGIGIGATTAYFVGSSLAVSWWVYDRSDLHTWTWLRPLLASDGAIGTRRWVLVHFGFDETGPSLRTALGAPVATVDLSAGLARTSPSLRRAQHGLSSAAHAAPGDARLPLRSASLDAVLLVFAAHEVRDRMRRDALFAELHRVLHPGGRVVLVEHLRDAANIAAFGPGAWHFRTRREWKRVATAAGFGGVEEARATAFVRGLALHA